MPKKDHRKCISCGEFYHMDEMMLTNGYGENDGDVCEDCYSNDEPACQYITPASDFIGYIGSYSRYLEEFWGENCYDSIEEHADSLQWVNTDGWRGYFDGKVPDGYSKVVNGWICGFDGEGTQEVKDFHEMWEEDKEQFSHIRMFVALCRTSNVFSTAVEAFVHNKDIDAFKGVLAMNGTPSEEVE